MKITKFFRMGRIIRSWENSEKGQALLIVLVLMLVGIVIVTSTLIYMGTTLKTNQVYIDNTTSLYAAEAGIEDGIWNVRYQTSTDLNGISHFEPVSPNTNPYTDYDFNTSGWTYRLSDLTTQNYVNVNNYPVDISLTNTWVPLGITKPSSNTAALSVLNNVGGTNPDGSHVNLIVSGQATPPYSSDSYSITVSYNGTADLYITSIGCWLPQGYSYNNSSSNLYTSGHAGDPAYKLFSTETTPLCAGNEAVVWTFPAGGKSFSWLQSQMAGQTPGATLTISFRYTTGLLPPPPALAWITVTTSSEVMNSYTWDGGVTVHDIIAKAGNTEIESFIPKAQTLLLGTAVSGDYVATGGSALTDINGDGLRETPIPNSSSTVSSITSDSIVQGAYLYWAGWMRGDGTGGMTATPYYDPSVTLNVTAGANNSGNQTITVSASNPDDIIWYNTVQSGRSNTITITAGSNTIVENIPTNGSADDIIVGDKITTSATGSTTWYTVTALSGVSGSNPNRHINITVSPTPSISPTPITVPYWVFDGYYYACKKDVTDIVKDFSFGAIPTNPPNPQKVFGDGDATYTVSNLYADTASVQHPGNIGDSAYGGWSLVIIYSNSTTLTHQLYLFDEFRSIPNNSGNNIIDINGFITPPQGSEPGSADAVKLTTFVGEGDEQLHQNDHVGLFDQSGTEHVLWDGISTAVDPYDTQSPPYPSYSPQDCFNSMSVGLNAPGIDIDTFHIPWSTHIVTQGDTSADINLHTENDGLVSIYVIASFRSEITSGGSISYLIRRKMQ